MKNKNIAHLFMKISFFAIIINSVTQLAISQIHIKAIYEMFTSTIGFYLFAFIIIGLITLFNVTRLSKRSNLFVTALFAIFTVIFGVIYLNLAITDKANSSTILLSVIVMAVGVLIYLGSAVLLIISGIKDPYANKQF